MECLSTQPHQSHRQRQHTADFSLIRRSKALAESGVTDFHSTLRCSVMCAGYNNRTNGGKHFYTIKAKIPCLILNVTCDTKCLLKGFLGEISLVVCTQ